MTAQPVISVQANDVSDSARAHSNLSKNACKARNSQLKPRDVQIDIIYADDSELRRDAEVNNTLLLMRQCSNLFDENDQQPDTGIRKLPGTSLESALDNIDTQISSKRTEGINFPAVIVITLHENEPVPGQPIPDIERIKDKISNLTRNNQGILVISGPIGQLQKELRKALTDNPKARICPFSDIKSCTQRAFTEGRRLHIE
ncbi:MAG: hypothetical protein SW833_15605 [Cyanobacteriota bacterium]|nr:hypothetical protein [Cyanobacteriota bacterium]